MGEYGITVIGEGGYHYEMDVYSAADDMTGWSCILQWTTAAASYNIDFLTSPTYVEMQLNGTGDPGIFLVSYSISVTNKASNDCVVESAIALNYSGTNYPQIITGVCTATLHSSEGDVIHWETLSGSSIMSLSLYDCVSVCLRWANDSTPSQYIQVKTAAGSFTIVRIGS